MIIQKGAIFSINNATIKFVAEQTNVTFTIVERVTQNAACMVLNIYTSKMNEPIFKCGDPHGHLEGKRVEKEQMTMKNITREEVLNLKI